MIESIQNTLTPEIIKESAYLYQTSFELIKEVGGFENFVYEFKKDDEDFIIRYVHSSHRTVDQVLAELEFIDFLDKNDACVSTVVHSINDHLVEVINIDEKDYFVVSVFKKAPGTNVKREELTNKFFEMFGEEVGKLHKITKEFKPKHKRIHWFEDPIFEVTSDVLPIEDAMIIRKFHEVINRIKQIPMNEDNYGLIHTDLHFGNMFYYEGKLTFFDWDDAMYKHFLSDIAIIIFYQPGFPLEQDRMDEESLRILRNFLKGYRKHNEIDMELFRHFNDFLMLRAILLYVVIHESGEEIKNSEFGKRYIKNYRERILNGTPFLTEKYLIEGLKATM